MHNIYIGLGSNLGNKRKNLTQAIRLIEERIGLVIAQSAFISTAPWGYKSENKFLNAAIISRTLLSPNKALEQTQSIEIEMGRIHTKSNYEDRIIDLDILFYDELIIKTDTLTIPHPLINQRLFVLDPLAEIAPDYIHPIVKKTIQKLRDKIKM